MAFKNIVRHRNKGVSIKPDAMGVYGKNIIGNRHLRHARAEVQTSASAQSGDAVIIEFGISDGIKPARIESRRPVSRYRRHGYISVAIAHKNTAVQADILRGAGVIAIADVGGREMSSDKIGA